MFQCNIVKLNVIIELQNNLNEIIEIYFKFSNSLFPVIFNIIKKLTYNL